MLQEYVARASTQVPALLKLVELCVDSGLESTMYDAQAQLCDAYLAGGQSAEARVIAEDLVAREPWERGHIERFRQALVMREGERPRQHHRGAPGAGNRRSSQPIISRRSISTEPPAEQPSASSSQATDATSQTAARGVGRARGTPAPSSEETEVDLTGVFASTPAPSLTDVFKSKAGPDSDDPGEQLKLARAYLDTGMPEEAIGALEAASRSPRHRFDAASRSGGRARGDFGKRLNGSSGPGEARRPD